MKKWMRIVALMLCATLLLAGCGNKNSEEESKKTVGTRKNHLTEDQIMTAAANHWNIKPGDRDPETGYLFSIMVLDHPTYENPTYRVVLRWLVKTEGETSHYSIVDTILLDAMTGEVLTQAEES